MRFRASMGTDLSENENSPTISSFMITSRLELRVAHRLVALLSFWRWYEPGLLTRKTRFRRGITLAVTWVANLVLQSRNSGSWCGKELKTWWVSIVSMTLGIGFSQIFVASLLCYLTICVYLVRSPKRSSGTVCRRRIRRGENVIVRGYSFALVGMMFATLKACVCSLFMMQISSQVIYYGVKWC